MPKMPPLPWDASCRCGRVRMRVTLPPLLSMACHCSGCQVMTGSAFSLSLVLPADGFAVLGGELSRGGLQAEHRHQYCAWCKSWLFTQPAGLDWLVNLRASTLADHGWYEPFIETATAEKLPWASTPARHSFAGFPGPEQYQPLIQKFARLARSDAA